MFICVHFKGRCCCMMLHCLFTYFICRSCCNFILLLVFTVQRYARAMLALALCLSVSISVTHQCFGEIAGWIELVSSMDPSSPYPTLCCREIKVFPKTRYTARRYPHPQLSLARTPLPVDALWLDSHSLLLSIHHHALTALRRLVYNLFLRLCSSWQDFNWHSTLCWRRGVVVSGLRQWTKLMHVGPRLQLGWVTVFGRVYHLGL